MGAKERGQKGKKGGKQEVVSMDWMADEGMWRKGVRIGKRAQSMGLV